MASAPPIVAIVGRPNVGKSTLLNALARRRHSVVHPLEGVTRDRVSVRINPRGRTFELVDTGGVGIVDVQDLSEDVERQITTALEMASVLIFVVDTRAGMTSADKGLARRLRQLDKPLVLVANKTESETLEQEAEEFRRLGLGDPILISAQNRENTGEVLDLIHELLPEPVEGEEEDPAEAEIKIAIVGRRNAGKSTFINSVAGSERVIVSERPGTTRDAVDVWVERDGETWVLIDTAGVTRRGGHDGHDPIQWYGQHRALRAVRRCDVAMLVLDSTRDVGTLEKRLAREIADAGKPCILVANKWDLVKDVSTGEFEEYFSKALPGVFRAPIAFVSAIQGFNLQKTLNVCRDLYAQASQTVGTGELNRFVQEAIDYRSPRIKSSRRPKVYYATQVKVRPPTIALFVNDPKLFDPAYRRYMQNRFRDMFPFPEVPVVMQFRKRERKSLPNLKGGG